MWHHVTLCWLKLRRSRWPRWPEIYTLSAVSFSSRVLLLPMLTIMIEGRLHVRKYIVWGIIFNWNLATAIYSLTAKRWEFELCPCRSSLHLYRWSDVVKKGPCMPHQQLYSLAVHLIGSCLQWPTCSCMFVTICLHLQRCVKAWYV